MLRPEAGFGSHHRIHSEESGTDTGRHMPLRIEFIDTEQNIATLLPLLEELLTDGLIEAQDTVVLRWRPVELNEGGGSLFQCSPQMRSSAAALWSQAPAAISLAEAQQIALRNHPRIASANWLRKPVHSS